MWCPKLHAVLEVRLHQHKSKAQQSLPSSFAWDLNQNLFCPVMTNKVTGLPWKDTVTSSLLIHKLFSSRPSPWPYPRSLWKERKSRSTQKLDELCQMHGLLFSNLLQISLKHALEADACCARGRVQECWCILKVTDCVFTAQCMQYETAKLHKLCWYGLVKHQRIRAFLMLCFSLDFYPFTLTCPILALSKLKRLDISVLQIWLR